jgi:hypothetical protein
MALNSLKDFLDAYESGRVHTQRFIKNNGSIAIDNTWSDWSFASGQPAYDARIGVANTFTPFVAANNDAIYFPAIESGLERRLASVNVASNSAGTGQQSIQFVMYDLVGVYPLIDGDSTDTQLMDNTLTLPRYSSGEGLVPVLVNHIAPQVQACNGTMEYVNSDGVSRTISINLANNGVTKIVSVGQSGGGSGGYSIQLCGGCKGIRSVTSIQFSTPPGGLYAIYIYKPLIVLDNSDDIIQANKKAFTNKCLCINNGFLLPRIYDGAWLGFFTMSIGGARLFSIYGDITFLWG